MEGNSMCGNISINEIVKHAHDRQNLMIPPEAAALIKSLRILVIGVGAGGNEVLKNLLLMGFGNFTLLDFDTVEDSNLSRTTLFRKEDIGKSKSIVAAERLQEMALHPNPNIVGLHGNFMTDFGKELFIEHDIVISCVDTQKCRAYINDWCVRTKTPFFEMGFEKYTVNITFFAPVGTMTQRDGTVIEKLPTSDGYFPTFNGEFPVCLREEIGYGVFDEKRNSCSGFKVKDTNLAKIPTIQVSAAMAGTLIATELVKFLCGIDSIRNKMLLYSGLSYETTIVSYNRSPKCNIHKEHMDIETFEVYEGESMKDVLIRMESSIENCSRVFLTLPDAFIKSGKCKGCGKEIEYNSRASELYDEERWCDDCRKKPHYASLTDYENDFVKIPKEISLKLDENYLNYSFQEVGVPRNDILECKVNYKSGEKVWKFVYLKQIDTK